MNIYVYVLYCELLSEHATLQLLSERDQARIDDNPNLEQVLAKKVRASVQHDKSQWLSKLIESGDWDQIKKLRKKFPKVRITLRDRDGNPTSSEARADTLASYFESIQWAVRPTEHFQYTNQLHQVDVDCSTVSYRELMIAIDQMKNNKKAGADDVPAEFWKCISLPGSNACNWMLSLFQMIWDQSAFQLHGILPRSLQFSKKVMQATVTIIVPLLC